MSIKPTEQQEQIVQSALSGVDTQVNASAGVGKSFCLYTCIEEINKIDSKKRMHYTAFNREIANESKSKIGNKAVSGTWHSLAYNLQRSKIQQKVMATGTFGKFLTGAQLLKHLGTNKPFSIMSQSVIGYECIKTVSNFCNSSDLQISQKHIPYQLRKQLMFNMGTSSLDAQKRDLLDYILECSIKAWDMISDFQYKKMPMSFDHYLKTLHTTNVDIGKHYDIFMVDEFQDTNPVCFEVMKNSSIEQSIIIGDFFQKIYNFRGAISDSRNVEGFKQYELTKSFRCSEQICEIANLALELHYDELPYRIEGVGPGVEDGSTAYIARTNAGILNKAAELMDNNIEFYCPKYHKILPIIENVYKMYKGQKSSMYLIDTFTELVEYAEGSNDIQLLSAISLIKKYKNKVPTIISKLRTKAYKKSNITLTNVHNSKGLEYETVELCEDFKTFSGLVVKNASNQRLSNNEASVLERMNVEEEINLLYVAITRAAKSIILYPQLSDHMGQAYLTNMLDS